MQDDKPAKISRILGPAVPNFEAISPEVARFWNFKAGSEISPVTHRFDGLTIQRNTCTCLGVALVGYVFFSQSGKWKNRAIGSVVFGSDGDHSVAILPKFQQKGLGVQMMVEALWQGFKLGGVQFQYVAPLRYTHAGHAVMRRAADRFVCIGGSVD